MKDKYIRETKDKSTILNLCHHASGHYAEIASESDSIGRHWILPGCQIVRDWPTARAKSIKIFRKAGYKTAC